MPPTKTVTIPLEVFRHFPAGSLKNNLRSVAFEQLGSPRGHPRLYLPRKQLLIEPGDTLIQVGTPNVGRISLYAKLLGNNGEGIIFEPNKNNYQKLLNSASEYSNIQIDPRAVSDSSSTVTMEVASDTPGGDRLPNLSAPDVPYEFDTTQEVEARTLDELVSDYEAEPDYIEIMINGTEPEALKGATQVMDEFSPRMLIKSYAVGVRENTRVDEVVEVLEEHDYQISFAPVRKSVPNEGSPDGDIFAWK